MSSNIRLYISDVVSMIVSDDPGHEETVALLLFPDGSYTVKSYTDLTIALQCYRVMVKRRKGRKPRQYNLVEVKRERFLY